jgi:iron(III) transport system ATP-binding protein
MKNGARGAPVANAIEIVGVSHAYGANEVLHKVDLSLPSGSILALLGDSGCGKTTLLRIVAGLFAPSAGRIDIGDTTVVDTARGIFVPPERRGLGMVFQDYALWPHFTVGQNVAFPLEMRGVPGDERRRRVNAALARVGLGGFEDRSPGTLSGGQQQRVAIARAIVAEPEVVLLDEPLSNLDKVLRDSLADEIASLVRSLGLTAIYVTHDHGEAFALADQVAVMIAGTVVQTGSPEELVDAPANVQVAEFLNLGVLARAELRDNRWWLTDAGIPLLNGGPAPHHNGSAMRVLLGRRALRLCDPNGSGLHGVVTKSLFRGDVHAVSLRIGSDAPGLEVIVPSEKRATPGERVGLAIDTERLRWFSA